MGARIVHKTDHMAVTFLRKCRLLSGRLMRWTLAIQDFDVRIEHCSGRKNIMADAISRYTTGRTMDGESGDKRIVISPLAGTPTEILTKKLKDISHEQEEDNLTKRITKDGKDASKYQSFKGVWHRNCNGTWKRILPENLLYQITTECHKIYGHIGPKKCFMMLREDFYLPYLHRRIKTILRSCLTCQRNKVSIGYGSHPTQPIVINEQLEVVFIDYYGPLASSRFGYKYVLAMLDGFTKYIKLYGVRKQTTSACLNKLFLDFKPSLGKPLRVVTDHGTQLTSPIWKNKL